MNPPVLRLSAGRYRAEIAEVGAALRRLRYQDDEPAPARELLYAIEAAVPTPPFAGAVLAPWPNRIADGRYRFSGQTHQLPIDEIATGNALHGLALWERWTPIETAPDAATLEHTIWARPGYPFTISVRVTYALDDAGLHVTLTATNRCAHDAPVGLSLHPYLTVDPDSTLDDWSLHLPCDEVILTDDRLLPQGRRPVPAAGLDFRTPAAIAAASIDHAFTGVAFDTDGRAAAKLTGPDGTGVRVAWDRACRWLQVYTMHAPGTPMHRRAVAIEPMTCAPDAFNSGAGLIVLAPGGSTTAVVTISATG